MNVKVLRNIYKKWVLSEQNKENVNFGMNCASAKYFLFLCLITAEVTFENSISNTCGLCFICTHILA